MGDARAIVGHKRDTTDRLSNALGKPLVVIDDDDDLVRNRGLFLQLCDRRDEIVQAVCGEGADDNGDASMQRPLLGVIVIWH